MKDEFKRTLIIVGVIILILINFLCFWIGYHNFLYPKLGKFEVKEINKDDEVLNVLVTPCHNAVEYVLKIYNEEKMIYETTSKEETIILKDFEANYNEQLKIIVYAKNKNQEEQKSENTFLYTYQDATFEKEKNHYLSESRDLTLNILGYNYQDDYEIELYYGNNKIYDDKVTSEDATIPYDVVDGYSGRITAYLKNMKNRITSSFNFYLNTPVVGKVSIISPIDNYTNRWNDIKIKYKGGENANNFYVSLYQNGILENKIEVIPVNKEITLSAAYLKEDVDYTLTLEAVYEDYTEIEETDSVGIHVGKKEATEGVYVSHNPTFIKSGTKVTLNTITKDATIYYTLDGSEPTINSMKYDSPFIIQNDTTIKTLAVSYNRHDSVKNTFNFHVEEKTPVIYLSPSNQDQNYGVEEAGYTTEMEIMNRVADILERHLKGAGFIVYRNNPNGNINLWVNQSLSAKADFHFALHSNASAHRMARGPEIHIDNEYSLAYSVASNIYENLWQIYDGNNNYAYHRGIKYTRGSLGEASDAYLSCSALIELAFHDEYNDAAWVINNIEKIGENLANSIISYYN